MKPSSIRSSLSRISPGGWVTIFLALVWSAGVGMYLDRGAISRVGQPVALYLTYPLADLNPIGGTISRYAVLDIDFFLATCAMTIPNLFILGYTAAACGKLVKWLVVRLFVNAAARDTNSFATRQEF